MAYGGSNSEVAAWAVGAQPSAPPEPAAPARVRRLVHARDYFEVEKSPRFRASERRRRWNAARHGMVIVIGAAALNCMWTGLIHPYALEVTAAVNLGLAVLATAAYVLINARPRRRPDDVVLAMLGGIAGSTVWVGVVQPDLAFMALGYLLLLPAIVALVIPWPMKIHFTWLLVNAAITLTYFVLARPASSVYWDAVLLLLTVSTVLSLFGHVTGLRARVLSFAQIESINSLNRQARRDRARLHRLNTLLDHSARTDELTGLKNRLSLRVDLAALRSRVARHRELYVLLLADLDHFKAINDKLGHVAGDGVLQTVADALSGAARTEDGVYRYGGEEFALLIQVASPADALLAAERMRRSVEALALPHPSNRPHDRLTLSVGATSIGRAELPFGDEELFGRADRALYSAKAAGRNCSLVWGQGVATAPGSALAGAAWSRSPTTRRQPANHS